MGAEFAEEERSRSLPLSAGTHNIYTIIWSTRHQPSAAPLLEPLARGAGGARRASRARPHSLRGALTDCGVAQGSARHPASGLGKVLLAPLWPPSRRLMYRAAHTNGRGARSDTPPRWCRPAAGPAAAAQRWLPSAGPAATRGAPCGAPSEPPDRRFLRLIPTQARSGAQLRPRTSF